MAALSQSDFLKLQTEKYEGQLKQVKKRLRLKLLPILKNQKERMEHKLFYILFSLFHYNKNKK